MPSKMRAPKRLRTPSAAAAANDAAVQMSVLMIPNAANTEAIEQQAARKVVTPHTASLYALERKPNITGEMPKASLQGFFGNGEIHAIKIADENSEAK